MLKDLRSPKVPPIFAPHLRENAGSRKFGWVAETTSLLNWRTRKGTGGSNPPASAKSQNKKELSFVDLALFKSIKFRWVRLTVRTHASHACNTSSILVPTTTWLSASYKQVRGFFIALYLYQSIVFRRYKWVLLKKMVQILRKFSSRIIIALSH